MEFVKDAAPETPKIADRTDRFRGSKLPLYWEWNVFQNPAYQLKGGELQLSALPVGSGHFTGQKTLSGNYTASVLVRPRKSNAAAGLAVIGDERNTLTLYYANDSVKLVSLRNGRDSTIAAMPVAAAKKMHLQVLAQGGGQFQFSFSRKGKHFTPITQQPVSGAYLPPWDRALRIGVAARGPEGSKAVFDKFAVDY